MGVKISELPAGSAANDTDQIEVNQAGVSRSLTISQITSLVPSEGGSLDFTQTAASYAPISLTIDPSLDANALPWRFSCGVYPGVNLPDTTSNDVFGFGWNWSSDGNGRTDPTEPAIGMAFERYFAPSGLVANRASEVHIQAWTEAGDAQRLFSAYTKHDGTLINSSITADTFVMNDRAGVVPFQFNVAGKLLDLNSSTLIRWGVNNVAIAQQQNAAGGYVNLPYIMSDDRLSLGRAFQAVGSTPTTGTYANNFAMFQAESMPANGTLIGGTITALSGSVNAFDIHGFISGSLTGIINNQKTSNSNASAVLRLETSATAGGKNYIVHRWGAAADIYTGTARNGKWYVATEVPGNGSTYDKFIVDTATGNISCTGVATALSATAVGAGAATQAFIKASSTADLGIYYGTGDPTFSAAKGSIYSRTDATTTTTRLWVNTNGSTTWASLTTSA